MFSNIKLKDVIKKVIDNRGRNPEKYFDIEKYPVIDNVLIKNTYYPNIKDANRFLDENTYRTFLRGYVHKNMPIITLVWSWIGNVTLCPSDDVAIVQNTIWFDVDKEKIDERFLYYWFLDNQQLIVKLNRWSGQPSIRKTDILDLDLKLPELSYQKKVVSLLSRLDLKIELNNQINHNLSYVT